MKINTAGSGHAGPVKNGTAEWLQFTAAQSKQQKMLEKAVNTIKSNIKGSKACNAAFKTLPNGRSFDDVFNDDTIWISYCPDNTTYGFTDSVGGKEITICEYAFRWGYWSVIGTLVHEMAHSNGADATTHAAEGTLTSCGLAKVHDPTIIGTRETEPVYIA